MTKAIPKLFVKGSKSRALVALEESSTEKGAGAFKAYDYKVKAQWDLTGRMADLGWMEQHPSGPRGGKRYHITALGRVVLEAVHELGEKYYERLWPLYPEMLEQNRRQIIDGQ